MVLEPCGLKEMAQPWKTLESIITDEGVLELRQRGNRDFLITIGSQILMNSLANRSEIVLGTLGCTHLAVHPAPQVLVGGLGMAFTLRAALDTLPITAKVTVAELNPIICTWCRGTLALLTDNAASDPRVELEIGDVSRLISRRSASGKTGFDAILLDLYRGPHARTDQLDDPFYGSRAIQNMRSALAPGGVLAIWSEQYDEGFANRLNNAGFTVTIERPGRGGLRHTIFLARLK